MGYAIVFGFCAACGTEIKFNPDRVPSITIKGHREPICRECFDDWNEIHRTSKGLKPIKLDPNAYKPEPGY